jgi:hypothetical protein
LVDESGVFAMRFLPHLTPGEGFFIAALRKIAPATAARAKSKSIFNAPGTQERTCLQQVGIASDGVVLAPDGELYKSAFTIPELNAMAAKLYLLQPGVRIGKVLRGELLPAHALALAQMNVLSDTPIQLNDQEAIPNDYATNSSGFSGLPNGNRFTNGSYYSIGQNSNWWSADQYNSQEAWFISMSTTGIENGHNHTDKNVGYPVRCLRD